MPQPKAQKRAAARGDLLAADDWLQAAREELIARGVLAVKVDRLSRRLKVSRGSFYWHFRSHAELLDRLLESWASTNTEPFRQTLRLKIDGYRKFQAIIDLWLSETDYDPQFDTAVREWARISTRVARVVHHADQQRIGVFRRIFRELGYPEPEALVRARITYFHQVGYYALGLQESASVRRKLRPYYTDALLGNRS
jgi:AcrR family transcriptional regulator